MSLLLTGLRWVRSQSAGGLSTGGLLTALYGGALGVALHYGHGPQRVWAVVLVAVVGVLAWAAALRRARAISNIATSRIASAAQGYVELQGRTSISSFIYSPVSNTPCIWYRYWVYERSGSSDEWREVSSDTSSATFDLSDGTGTCTIDPDYAEVTGAPTTTRYRGNTKEVEALLHGGSTLYALGDFVTVGGANSVLNQREDVSELLASWKENTAELHRRFDLNRDGIIDQKEWELARRLATSTIEKEHRSIRAQPGTHVLRAPQDGRLFLLSPLSPQSLRRRYLLWSGVHLLIGLAAAFMLGRYMLVS